jgi:esterase/lipase superfamily enzyme
MKTNATWYSPRLRQDVQVVRWGHFGMPVLLFPTAGGDAEECERFLMIKALKPLLDQGRIKLFACDSVGGRTMTDSSLPAHHKAWAQRQFLSFVRNELVPAIRADCNDPNIGVVAAGASIGAYNALLSVTTHPDVFTHAICMSGTYILDRFLQGFHNQDVHCISPTLYLPYMAENEQLQQLRKRHVLFATGEGKWEAPHESWRVANLLGAKGIPNRVDLWGKEYHHDWVTWRDMLPKYLDEMTRA